MFVPLALAAAFCFAAAVVLQQRSAAEHGAHWHLLRRGLWLAGSAVDFIGFLLHVGALHLGGVVAVQALLTTTLPFGLVLGRTRPGRVGWFGAALLAVGLAGLLLALDPHPGQVHTDGVVLATIAVSVVSGLTWWAGGPVPQAFGAALLFALTAALAAGVGDQFASHGLTGPLPHPELYLLALAASTGLILEQRAFAAGPLAPSLVTLTLADPLASVALGTTVTGDRLRGGSYALAAGAAGALASAGVIILARAHQGRESAPAR